MGTTLSPSYDYDFFVIGGGPGGTAASKEASKYNIKVGIADFVTPSPQGSSWGLGGTCVNVGCIPKKMMHFAALLYNKRKYYKMIGNPTEISKEHNWETLVENVQLHIKSLNFGYRNQFRQKKIIYHNKLAKLIDSHTIELTDKKGNVEKVTSKYILICTGGRPSYPNIPGAKEFCITSDDLFSLKKPPGKTLIIGASYIAVECSGILASLGYDTTIMVRSMLLRGFDRDMAKRVEDILIHDGIKFLNKCTPQKFSKNPNGKIKVEYQNENGEKLSDEFDTVLLAVGRKANTQNLNLEKIGIKLSKNGKIIVDEYEQTSINNIYSIGDCAEGRPELAPPVIMAGKLLSRRLFNGDREIVDYNNIATTIYSSIEYGSCGMSEEKAKEYYGKDNIKVYHSEFTPVEWTIDPENEMTCYIKVIVNTYEYDKVVGFHIFSPNAGEITQGVSVAMKCGLTKDLLDCTIGIHPTIAEEMTTLDVTKDMGSGKKTSC